jgi:tetratricopeptide (TPR) repeat protein
MNIKRIHYIFAGASFLISLLVYLATMQPSIPFWDCGEFAASAWALQIGHPPGAALWTLLGRFAMMLPTYSDPVARYNLFSVLSSSLTIMILYLTVARLIRIWRGEPKSVADVITHYGGAFVAAMCYTFTDSFWFNALECEVYAFGSLFVAMIPWLILVWYDHAEEEHSEKYILLISYVIGLSMTVHQLALLTIFPVFMLIYYRRRKNVTITSWLGMVVASVIAFLIAYKIVLSKLVEWLATTPAVTVLLLAACVAGIYYSQKKRKALLNLSLWSAMLMFLGYSCYALLMVRAAQEPPMNQWHVSNFSQISKFINREQYGDRGQFPRRQGNGEPGDENGPIFTNYSSDWDFFLRYQTNHMYDRYLMWNFVGRVSQKQDTGTDWSKTWGIPFFLGLFGMYWHFRRDPKRALSMFAMFAMMGWATAWYQNQQEPQPRERDYFYVGAFYVYAMWVGIGATGLIEIMRRKKKKEGEEDGEGDAFPIVTGEGNVALAGGLLLGALILVPLNQAVGLAGMATGKTFQESSKWAEYNRAHNNIPLEYAYNVLQSCDKDAILFTAGDNDTFPLWCAQDVYGVRRDVRIVNLSLGNMSWYIKQLTKDVWGIGKKVDLPGFTSAILDAPDDTQEGVHPFRNEAMDAAVDVTAETMRKFTGVPNAVAATINWKYTGQYQLDKGSYYFAVSDQIVRSIVEGNINKRPIYFANVVPNNYLVGLSRYLVSEGLTKRLTPLVQSARSSSIIDPINEQVLSEMIMNFVPAPVKEPKRALLLNTFIDPASHWSSDDRTNDPSFFSYQKAYLSLANFYVTNELNDKAKAVLDTFCRRFPLDRFRIHGTIAQLIGKLYRKIGDEKSAVTLMKAARKDFEARIAETKRTGGDISDDIGPYLLGVETMIESGDPQAAIDVLKELLPRLSERERPMFDLRYLQAQGMLLEQKGDKKGALAKYDELFTKYGSAMAQTPDFQDVLQWLIQKRYQLMDTLGVNQDSALNGTNKK